MDKKVKLILSLVAVLIIAAGVGVYFLFINNKKKTSDSFIGKWDYYTSNGSEPTYAGVSFEFKDDKTFKMTGSTEEDGLYERFDNYIILKYKVDSKDDKENYALPYVLYINDNKVCVNATNCDGSTDTYFKKREGDSTPEVKTTVSTTTKAPTLDASQVTMYIFHGDGCPHCAELMGYIDSDDFFKDVKIVKYETWYDTNNQELIAKVGKKLGIDIKGVPFILIGDEYFEGYGSEMNDKIKEKITYYKKNKSKYKDIVYKLVK